MTASKCIAYGLTKVFVSGVTINNRLSVDVVKSVNNKIIEMCNENNFTFIDNSNISKSHIYEDGLHLADNGRSVLVENFTRELNSFLSLKNQTRLSVF